MINDFMKVYHCNSAGPNALQKPVIFKGLAGVWIAQVFTLEASREAAMRSLELN